MGFSTTNLHLSKKFIIPNEFVDSFMSQIFAQTCALL